VSRKVGPEACASQSRVFPRVGKEQSRDGFPRTS
jgi:hypothetical protein